MRQHTGVLHLHAANENQYALLGLTSKETTDFPDVHYVLFRCRQGAREKGEREEDMQDHCRLPMPRKWHRTSSNGPCADLSSPALG